MRPLWAAAGLLLAAPAIAAFRGGDLQPFLWEQMLFCAVAFGMLALLALLAPWPLVARGLPLWALAALAALAGWTVLSLSWARIVGDAKHDAVRAVLYLLAFAVALVVMRAPRIRAAAAPGLLAAISVVVLYALGQRMLPWIHDPAGDLLPGWVGYTPGALAGSRLDAPLAYWNALGLLTAFGCLLGVTLASDEARSARTRAIACAAIIPSGVALYLTLSRGALLALAVGLLVLVLVRPRGSVLASAATGLGLAGLVVLLLQALPAVRDLARPESDRESQGALAMLLVALAATGAALLHARASRSALGRRDLPLRGRTPLWIGLAAIAAVIAVGTFVVTRAERTESLETGQARLATLNTIRGDYWSVAAGSFADHPLTGVGAASFQVEWRRERDTPDVFTYHAHSLYLETLAELGLPGFLFLAAFGAVVVAGLSRRQRGDPVLAAAAPVLAAFAVHAGLDWDWEWPALVLPVLILAAAALQPDARPTDERAAPAA